MRMNRQRGGRPPSQGVSPGRTLRREPAAARIVRASQPDEDDVCAHADPVGRVDRAIQLWRGDVSSLSVTPWLPSTTPQRSKGSASVLHQTDQRLTFLAPPG